MMPARLELSPEEALARVREQAKTRMRRYRARRDVTGDVTALPALRNAPKGDAPAQASARTRGPGPSLPEKEKLQKQGGAGGVDHAALARIFAPLGDRADPYDPALWDRLHLHYPTADLVLEAMAMVSWLQEPRQRLRRSNARFAGNWLKRQTPLPMAPAPGVSRSNGQVVQGQYVQPASQQRNPGPEPLPQFPRVLERIGPEELHRALRAGASLPLADKLAAIRQGGTRP